MGHEDAESTVPTAKGLADHLTQNWTAEGVYPRGTGDGFVSIVLPSRFDLFPTFIDEVRQLAGRGSRIVFVATSEETRLDVYLGNRYEDGVNPIKATGPSTCKIVTLGAFSGILSALGLMAVFASSSAV